MRIKLFIAAVALMFVSVGARAQDGDIKIGYTNVDYILNLLPEAKQIEADLTAYQSQLGKQLQSKMQDFQQKLQTFQQGADTMTDVVRQDKQEELQNMQASIQNFQREADSSIQQKQAELMAPAYNKIQKAIDQVAKENGYTHIFSSDASGFPILLYAQDEDNISDLVLKNLGVTPPSEAASEGGN